MGLVLDEAAPEVDGAPERNLRNALPRKAHRKVAKGRGEVVGVSVGYDRSGRPRESRRRGPDSSHSPRELRRRIKVKLRNNGRNCVYQNSAESEGYALCVFGEGVIRRGDWLAIGR